MIAVIADDITGAAEVAGIAWRRGLRTQLVTGAEDAFGPSEVVVVATDARQMPAAEAAAETAEIAARLKGRALLFRKTDSALRGHVTAELGAMMKGGGADSVLYVPANPSKGRIIRGGRYLINGVPIDETPFASDPEYPARSARLSERFPEMCPWRGASVSGRICYADAERPEDMDRIVSQTPREVLLAGAADLFEALLRREYPQSEARKRLLPALDQRSLIVVCGSTLSRSIRIGAASVPMPRAVYDGECGPGPWIEAAQACYDRAGAVILTIPHHPSVPDPGLARRLRTVTAVTTAALIARRSPRDLVIEGGATAFAVLQTSGWTTFQLAGEIAPGVVTLQASGGTRITLKPGSYSWGGLFGME